MSNHLVIVESPAKAKTISKYLGEGYEVLASFGHVRDLRQKSGAVDPDNQFHMTYEVVEKNAKHVAAIAKALKKADSLLLATDPDREGEAIAWAVQELMKEQKILKKQIVKRVVFHEITKSAIQEAIQHPRDLDMDLVNAQQARRALDYLVGYTLSPLLWKKIRRGLSAGRVQSPALRMISEREDEIEKFIREEYWTIHADALTATKQALRAKLIEYNNEKLEQFSITNTEQAHEIQAKLMKMANHELIVERVERKQRKRNPAAPFTTSTLQQEAARKLGMTAQRTMRIAQQLYEGIDIGQGSVGLITYMRTDSVTLAGEALSEIRELIGKRYGSDFLPDTIREYRTKSKNAQEAHEAIRPTSAQRTPEEMKSFLSIEQYKLYSLIWKRTMASQMIHALIDTVSIDLSCGGPANLFRANGSTINHAGFMSVYQEDQDDAQKEDGEDVLLPTMKEGDKLALNEITPEQHFTEPPPRYSEASLIKSLEEHGIGRPSTYASIISTLQQREYAILDKKRFFPTDVGRIVNRFLTQHFTQYVDYDFTAKLEDELDAISRGEKVWIPVLDDFWRPFKHQIGEIEQNVARSDVTQEKLDEACPTCGKPLSIRLGKRGRFIGCSGYPECSYTRNMDNAQGEAAEPEVPVIVEGRSCPTCESPLHIRQGRYGKFIGCTAYPTCKYMEPLNKPADTGIECPTCKTGTMLERKSRYGKLFYSCSRYPDCKYAIWNLPLAEPCPKCKWPVVMVKVTKRRGTEKVCPQEECDFTEVMIPPEKKA
ncbi:MAG: type I DNA topoisomerase [Gammaproteobacteria bacterium]|nr:type I DNA topoisomerase [Gammaproteobacteria bacterium]